jgi:hypothetical protein
MGKDGFIFAPGLGGLGAGRALGVNLMSQGSLKVLWNLILSQ